MAAKEEVSDLRVSRRYGRQRASGEITLSSLLDLLESARFDVPEELARRRSHQALQTR